MLKQTLMKTPVALLTHAVEFHSHEQGARKNLRGVLRDSEELSGNYRKSAANEGVALLQITGRVVDKGAGRLRNETFPKFRARTLELRVHEVKKTCIQCRIRSSTSSSDCRRGTETERGVDAAALLLFSSRHLGRNDTAFSDVRAGNATSKSDVRMSVRRAASGNEYKQTCCPRPNGQANVKQSGTKPSHPSRRL